MKNNSEFVPIPTARLKDRIEELCHQYSLRFVETEESYTSKTSYLDGDYLPKLGEKPQDWKPSGRITKRGLYRTKNNWYINADCNYIPLNIDNKQQQQWLYFFLLSKVTIT